MYSDIASWINLALGTILIFLLSERRFGKLVNMKVTHDGVEGGSGWLLNKLIVMQTDNYCSTVASKSRVLIG